MLANFSNLITFSRGSNATVTDASGRLTYAPHNLLTNSQDFEAAAWTKTAASITANSAVAPDGTTTADTITEDTTPATAHRVYQVATNQTGPVIASIYVKAGTRSWLYIRMTDSASVVKYAYFNVSTGTLGTVDAGITASITPAGNGWYRCAALVNAVISMTCVFAITDANGNPVHNGNGTGTLSLWGAQLEAVTYQTTPSPYVSTSVANLLGFSEDFTNAAWTKVGSSFVTGVAQNPINNLWNAQKLMENTANSQHYVAASITTPTAPVTLSVYAKAAERSWMTMYLGAASTSAYFNLAAGTLGTVQSNVTASITPVGNGWYRCSITAQSAASGTLTRGIYVANADNSNSYTGDGNSGIYIYGAQLSNSGSLDPYVPTPGAAPSSTAYYGPRFDYDPVTLAAKGILIEEQRTNLLTYSEQFDNAAWAKSGVTITANNIISPDGSLNADRVTAAGASTLTQSAAATATSHTFTVFAKQGSGAGEGARFLLRNETTGTNLVGILMDYSTGSFSYIAGSSGATVTAVGNGWWRITLSATSGITIGNNLLVYVGFTGGGSAGQFMYAYGAQLEAGAFATSYIPTVASQVTRSADVASITGSLFSQWYRQDEGTMVVNCAPFAVVGDIAFSVSTSIGFNNSIYVLTDNTYQLAVVNGSVVQAAPDGGTVLANANNKIAAVYKVNDFAVSLNGGAAATDTSGTIPTVDRAVIGGLENDTNNRFNGHIRTVTYIPNRVSDTQLQSATT